MNAPVSLVTIHHEGAGKAVDWARGGGGGYSLWIGDVGGDHVYNVLRNPWISWATIDFNHVSLDVCLSGDRDVVPVTDADIVTIAAAVNQARQLGWVVARPLVRPHKLSPGSNTVCPGTNTMARWADVEQACMAAATPAPAPPATTEEEMPSFPSTTKPANTFRGAIVDLANRHVTLSDAAECDPSPAVIPTNVAWLGAYGGKGAFTVFLSNLAEYHFTLP